MHRILVPLDGSEFSERAIPWANTFAATMHADVELLEVLDGGSRSAQREGPFGPETDALARARGLFTVAVRTMSVASDETPATEIAKRSRTVGATLIVMASHGRSGLARAVLGSVTSETISHTEAPVLVVPPNASVAPSFPSRVLAPLDRSETSRLVFDWLCPLAAELSWSLVLGSVADLPTQSIPVQGAAIPIPAGHPHTPADVQAYLDGVAAELNGNGLRVETQVGLGDTAAAINQMVTDSGASLIAMVSRGRRGAERWTLGSVTEAVIRSAMVPVLAHHPTVERRGA